MIDFPANPVVNQTFAAPNGVTYKCTSADPDVWTSISTGTAVPEAPADAKLYGRKDMAWSEVTKAALGLGNVTDVAAVAKAGDTMTGPLLLPDGTVAAPALAFSAETGLGWYRKGASRIGVAAQGVDVGLLNASSVNTDFQIYPRAAGGSAYITLTNAPGNAADSNALQILSASTGYNIAETLKGAATTKPLMLTFPAGVKVSSQIDLNSQPATSAIVRLNKPASGVQSAIVGQTNGLTRWVVAAGNSGAETGANAGSNFQIIRSNDAGVDLGTPFQIQRDTGIVRHPEQPAFSAQGCNPVAAGAYVIFGAVTHNIGNCYSAATGRFTAPIMGRYFFRFNAMVGGPSTGEIRMALRINQATDQGSHVCVFKPASQNSACQSQAIMNLNAGDFVSVFYEVGPDTLFSADARFSSFSGFMVA